jgi:hypothetical protein
MSRARTSRRDTELTAAVGAGYHGDQGGLARLLVESIASQARIRDAFERGRQARRDGLRCDCIDCRHAREETT